MNPRMYDLSLDSITIVRRMMHADSDERAAVGAGSQGLARAAVWYSPKRKEAMAELRLF